MPAVETICFQCLTRFWMLACLGCVFLIVRPGLAQEANDVTLDQLQQQWSELDAQFSAKEELLKTGEGDTEAIGKEYSA